MENNISKLTEHTNWLPVLVSSDSSLPITHLQINKRAHNLCLQRHCHTIGDVVEALKTGRLSPRNANDKSFAEITAAIKDIASLGGFVGRVNWDIFWESRPVVMPSLAMASASLERLQPRIREMDVSCLNLSKSLSGLRSANINSVGNLIDRARQGIGKLNNFHHTSQAEVVEALKALSGSIRDDGDVNWEEYAVERRLLLIPEARDEGADIRALFRALPEICEQVVSQQKNDRAWQLFKRRLIVPENKRETLDDLGRVYSLTRERVRQIVESCIDDLRRPIFCGDYSGAQFRLRENVGHNFQRARKHFDDLGVPAWTETNWIQEMSEFWNVTPDRIRRYDRLLYALLGFRCCSGSGASQRLDPIILDDTRSGEEETKLLKAVECLHQILQENILGLDSFGIVLAMKQCGLSNFSLDDVPTIAELCSNVEALGDCDHYRIIFPFIQGKSGAAIRANQAVRVLHDNGSPMHVREIMRAINQKLRTAKRIRRPENMVNQMSSDSRLTPIGTSGLWALTEWGKEVRPLVEIIADALETEGAPLHVESIKEFVLSRRHGSPDSIHILLDTKPDRFRKLAHRVYGLATWGHIDPRTADSDEGIGQLIENFMLRQNGNMADFEKLRMHLQANLRLESRAAAARLNNHPSISVKRKNSYQRIAVYHPNWRKKPVIKKARNSRTNRPRQADVIIDFVSRFLKSGPRSLIEVVKTVHHDTKIPKPTVYAVINQAGDFVKEISSSTGVKILRLRDDAFAVGFP